MRAVEGLKPGLSKEMYDLGLESDVKHIVRIEGKPQITIPVDHKKGEFFMIGWRFSQELLASKLEASRIHCNHRFMSYKPTEVISLLPFVKLLLLSSDIHFCTCRYYS